MWIKALNHFAFQSQTFFLSVCAHVGCCVFVCVCVCVCVCVFTLCSGFHTLSPVFVFFPFHPPHPPFSHVCRALTVPLCFTHIPSTSHWTIPSLLHTLLFFF